MLYDVHALSSLQARLNQPKSSNAVILCSFKVNLNPSVHEQWYAVLTYK